jgi:hypothetical protein
MTTKKVNQDKRYAEVVRAVRALEAAGEKVTVSAVRKHLGGGSFSTLTPLVARARETPEVELEVRDLPPLPPEVQQAWLALQAQAMALVGDERQQHAETVAKLRSQLEDEREAVGVLEAEAEALTKTAAEAAKQASEAIEKLRKERDEARQEAAREAGRAEALNTIVQANFANQESEGDISPKASTQERETAEPLAPEKTQAMDATASKASKA